MPISCHFKMRPLYYLSVVISGDSIQLVLPSNLVSVDIYWKIQVAPIVLHIFLSIDVFH